MTLDEILDNLRDQDRGQWFDLVDPSTGAPTGIRLRVVGPDSATAQRARIAFADELAELADIDGRVSGENREKAQINSLAAHVLDWQITESGEPVPFSTANLKLILAAMWVRAQVDAFASDRAAYGGAA